MKAFFVATFLASSLVVMPSRADISVNLPQAGCGIIMGGIAAGATAIAASEALPQGRAAVFLGNMGIFIGAALGYHAGAVSCDSINAALTNFSLAMCSADVECSAMQRERALQLASGLAADLAVCPTCSVIEIIQSAFMTTHERQQKLQGIQYLNAGTFTGHYVIPHSSFWSGVNTAPMSAFLHGVSMGVASSGGGGGPSFSEH